MKTIRTKILFISLFLSAATAPSLLFSASMEVDDTEATSKIITMPNTQILEKRLADNGFIHFMQTTNIVKYLADQNKAPIGVSLVVAASYLEYDKHLKERFSAKLSLAQGRMDIIEKKKRQLFELLLEDAPEALKELEEGGSLD